MYCNTILLRVDSEGKTLNLIGADSTFRWACISRRAKHKLANLCVPVNQ